MDMKIRRRQAKRSSAGTCPLAEASNNDVDEYVTKRTAMLAISRAKDPKEHKPPRLLTHASINRQLDVLPAA